MLTIMELLPKFQSDKTMPNVKLVYAVSYELFQLQTKEYRDSILHKSEWLDSTVISNGCKMGMHPWLASKIAEGYAMTGDHDNRWRVGGSSSYRWPELLAPPMDRRSKGVVSEEWGEGSRGAGASMP
jgi:hypothetical protein